MAISAQRLGRKVVAVDKYANAPAMQVADTYEVVDMLNAITSGHDGCLAVLHASTPDDAITRIEQGREEGKVEKQQLAEELNSVKNLLQRR